MTTTATNATNASTAQQTPGLVPLISGKTELIAHIGFPTESFKAPMIYNPWFVAASVNAVVVPMACIPEDFPQLMRAIFQLKNLRGALITMPHKVSVVALLDETSTAVKIAGACNAVRRSASGALIGDMFDGAGFVRSLQRKGLDLRGVRVLVIGCGGVGSAIAATLASEGVGHLALFDSNRASAQALAQRVQTHFPTLAVQTDSNDPNSYQLIVNASPLGMDLGDPLPVDMTRVSPSTFVGEVVMKSETTAFVAAAQAIGCRTQTGTDMLFEQIPAYLEFFGLPSTSADNLRQLAQLHY